MQFKSKIVELLTCTTCKWYVTMAIVCVCNIATCVKLLYILLHSATTVNLTTIRAITVLITMHFKVFSSYHLSCMAWTSFT